MGRHDAEAMQDPKLFKLFKAFKHFVRIEEEPLHAGFLENRVDQDRKMPARWAKLSADYICNLFARLSIFQKL